MWFRNDRTQTDAVAYFGRLGGLQLPTSSVTHVKQLPVPKLARERAHRAVVAWMCRRCKRQRLKKAKLKYLRLAQKPLLKHISAT